MEIKSFVVNPIGENCYILSVGKEGAIIDCGAFERKDWLAIKRYLEEKEIILRYALQTHMHFDHVFGLHFVKEDFGLSPLCHIADQQTYNHVPSMTTAFMGQSMYVELPKVEEYLRDGQKLKLGDKEIEVIHTPGHTPGGLCFYVEEESVLFSGDTLFQCSIGRTDFPGGSMSMEISSIRERLFSLPDETVVYPGHGGHTTIGYEKVHNMYL